MDEVEYRGEILEPWYHVSITNVETKSMFYNMFRGWFKESSANYSQFVKAILNGSVKEMNIFMNDVAMSTFSCFDTGTHPSERSQPEKFYHGFVLGLISELRDTYEIKSNRESGYGRFRSINGGTQGSDPSVPSSSLLTLQTPLPSPP